MNKFYLKMLLAIFLLQYNSIILAQEVLDKIVAIVDKEIILKSELDFQVNMAAAKATVNPENPELINQVLNAMVSQKLLYAQAEIDTIVISDDEVEQQLDFQINFLTNQYGSRDRVEKTYGMSIERIRREFKEDVRKNMMAERLKQLKFGNVDVTRREVKEFFTVYKDSLGLIPEKFDISHIFINPKATKKVKDSAFKFAEALLDSIKNGVDFAQLAQKYSDDPGSASQGGDLGTVKRGVFYPEFEAAAYSLSPGELSGIVESPVGFHIIELLDRKGESIHARHILVKIEADDESDLTAIELLTGIRDSILSEFNDFSFYANLYSDDKQTSNFGGKLGEFEIGQLDDNLRNKIYNLKEGEISFPKRLDLDNNTYGYHIIKLNKRTLEHKAELEKDYEEIKRLAQFQKRENIYFKWLEELKTEIYWEIKL
ncbi:peptidylprolyl isomerase [Bacteroidota bacterium]